MKSLNEKIKASLNKDGSEPKSNDFHDAIAIIKARGEKVYVGYYTGSGRFSKSARSNPEKYLAIWGVDHESGNDAPRGGVSGDYVKLTSKGKRQTGKLVAQWAREIEEKK